jgi:polyisoprenoid-binding protein YceI
MHCRLFGLKCLRFGERERGVYDVHADRCRNDVQDFLCGCRSVVYVPWVSCFGTHPCFFPLNIMRRSVTVVILTSFFLLSACRTSSLSEAERAPLPTDQQAFGGQMRKVDSERSAVSFVGKSSIVDHEGKFNAYTVDITLDPVFPADLEKARIIAEIDIASVEVDAAGLQTHLMKEEFFDVDRYPKATFVSTTITSTGGNTYMVTGDVTIKGTTASMTFPVEITDAYLTAHIDIPRKTFGIGNDSYGEKLLDPSVPVDVKIVFQQ